MSEERVTYTELKLSHAKQEKDKRHPAHKTRENPCRVILGTVCLLLLLVITGLGYKFFQKCPKCTTQDMVNTKEQNTSLIPVFQKCPKCITQDMGNTKEKNTSSVRAEDHSVVPSGREQDSGSLQGRHFCCGRNCYYFSKEEVTWEESRNLCRNMGSSLVKIDDIQEQNFIQSQIEYTYWIGLYRKEDKHEWMWQDSTKLAQHLDFHHKTKVDEKCGCLKPHYIDSADCKRHFRYICEKNDSFFIN